MCALFFCALIGCAQNFSLRAQGNVAPQKSTNAPVANSSELLELLDGSTLHGQLRSIDSKTGLKWDYPAAKQPIVFKPDNVASIRFPNATEVAGLNEGGNCQFQFANGDEFYGKLLSLDANEMELQTWFGGKFKTPRDAVRSIRFLPKGSAVLYEGPTSLDGWQVGKTPNPQAWRYEDGALIADSVGTIGRDLKLPDASSVEFDLAWNAPFSLLFSFYTGKMEGFNYNSSSYMFYLTAGNISLQRISAGTGSTSLGRNAVIPDMASKRKVHLEFRGNKEENFLELLADGKSVAQWKDSAGWVGQGSGILFFTQTDGGLKISNIKVSSWDGKPGSEIVTNAPVGEDQIYLANRDKVSGKAGNLRGENLQFKSTAAALEIPLPRISQIVFGNIGTNSIPRAPWEIQAAVSGGGKISFALENWTSEKVFGQNKNFGKISLNSKSIRQIQFNLGQARAGAGQFNPIDDVIWEGDGK